MTEKEMRDAPNPWPKTLEELLEYTETLRAQKHDYGTCVYAMSLAAVAMFNFMGSELGVTGFQASCADMDFLKRTRSMKNGFRILDYDRILYPQYCNNETFPTWREILNENRVFFAKLAKDHINNADRMVHEEVLKHWVMIAGKATEEEIKKLEEEMK